MKGSDIIVDLDGSSPQVDWGGNVVYNFTYAYVFMAVKSMFDPDIPNNDGCARPITLKAPEGTVVNCSFPAAVAARMQIGHFMTEIIYRALAQAVPEQVIAASGGTPATMNVFYGRRKDGKPWHSVIIRGGGMGASASGRRPLRLHLPGQRRQHPGGDLRKRHPADRGEEGAPHRLGRARQDAKGAWAGGWSSGSPTTSMRPLPPVNLGIQSGRYRYPPEGLFGGKARGQGAVPGQRAAGEPLRPDPAETRRRDRHGCGRGRWVRGSPGAGPGTGASEDVIEGYVSMERARRDYGVVIDSGTMKADLDATLALRGSLKRAA